MSKSDVETTMTYIFRSQVHSKVHMCPLEGSGLRKKILNKKEEAISVQGEGQFAESPLLHSWHKLHMPGTHTGAAVKASRMTAGTKRDGQKLRVNHKAVQVL